MAYGHIRRAGRTQLAFGIISLLIGIGSIITFVVASQGQVSASSLLSYVAYIASPLYCSIWAIVAGACGSCASAERSGSMSCIKVCVIVFSILATLAALAQVALCAVVGFLYVGSGYLGGSNIYMMVITILVLAGGLFGLLTFFVSIVHASIGCCCPGEAERQEQYQMK